MPDNILAEMPRFRRVGRNRYFAEIDGRKIGVVLATQNPTYDDLALNKSDLDRVVAAKRDGKLDDALVVAARIDHRGAQTFFDQIDGELLQEKLASELPRDGKFGEFYVLPPTIGFPARDDEPF
jgi:hypothetical protein